MLSPSPAMMTMATVEVVMPAIAVADPAPAMVGTAGKAVVVATVDLVVAAEEADETVAKAVAADIPAAVVDDLVVQVVTSLVPFIDRY